MKIDFSICKDCLRKKIVAGHLYEKPYIKKYIASHFNGEIHFYMHIVMKSDCCFSVGNECQLSVDNPEELFKKIFPNVDVIKSGREEIPEKYNELLEKMCEISEKCAEYDTYCMLDTLSEKGISD